MLGLHILLLSTVAFVSTTKEAIAFLLPRTVWCHVEPQGSISVISARPDGVEVPHGATMTVGDGRPGEAPIAYYYPEPTPLLETMNRFGLDPGTALLLATGREATTRSGRWREFRRCSEEEFDAALASWKRRGGG
jgi:hypothetical protein